jgi:uncharacterized membrane protein YfcA
MFTAALLGGLIGLTLALTGAGGGIIAVPLLMFVFHWTLPQAAPVALLAVGSSAAVGALLGLRARIVRYRAALLMAVVGALLTPVGLAVAHRVPTLPLTLGFAVLLLYIAQQMFRQATLQIRCIVNPMMQTQAANPDCQSSIETGRFRLTAPCFRAMIQAGAATGFLSGLLGVGGGFVIVPALRKFTDLPMNAIVATSLMVISLVSASAVASAIFSGHLETAVAVPFAAGAITAMLAGRLIASRLAGPRLQQGFALIATMVALGMIIKYLI